MHSVPHCSLIPRPFDTVFKWSGNKVSNSCRQLGAEADVCTQIHIHESLPDQSQVEENYYYTQVCSMMSFFNAEVGGLGLGLGLEEEPPKRLVLD